MPSIIWKKPPADTVVAAHDAVRRQSSAVNHELDRLHAFVAELRDRAGHVHAVADVAESRFLLQQEGRHPAVAGVG